MLSSNSNILSKVLLKCIKFSNPCSIRDDSKVLNISFYGYTWGRDALTWKSFGKKSDHSYDKAALPKEWS